MEEEVVGHDRRADDTNGHEEHLLVLEQLGSLFTNAKVKGGEKKKLSSEQNGKKRTCSNEDLKRRVNAYRYETAEDRNGCRLRHDELRREAAGDEEDQGGDDGLKNSNAAPLQEEQNENVEGRDADTYTGKANNIMA